MIVVPLIMLLGTTQMVVLHGSAHCSLALTGFLPFLLNNLSGSLSLPDTVLPHTINVDVSLMDSSLTCLLIILTALQRHHILIHLHRGTHRCLMRSDSQKILEEKVG
jgi:hypothetical protein